MKIGTKSILFGAHAFWLHPFLVAWAWIKIWGTRLVEYGRIDADSGQLRVMGRDYKLPDNVKMHVSCMTSIYDWRLWLAFFVHDIGYWGQPNMDGKEGESHPYQGALLMERWCDRDTPGYRPWGDFTAYHSGYYARYNGHQVSALYYADKLAFSLEWGWLYVFRTRITGEIREFRNVDKHVAATHGYISAENRQDSSWRGDMEWFRRIKQYHIDLARPARVRIYSQNPHTESFEKDRRKSRD